MASRAFDLPSGAMPIADPELFSTFSWNIRTRAVSPDSYDPLDQDAPPSKDSTLTHDNHRTAQLNSGDLANSTTPVHDNFAQFPYEYEYELAPRTPRACRHSWYEDFDDNPLQLERPHASPNLSPQPLPALCSEPDADEESGDDGDGLRQPDFNVLGASGLFFDEEHFDYDPTTTSLSPHCGLEYEEDDEPRSPAYPVERPHSSPRLADTQYLPPMFAGPDEDDEEFASYASHETYDAGVNDNHPPVDYFQDEAGEPYANGDFQPFMSNYDHVSVGDDPPPEHGAADVCAPTDTAAPAPAFTLPLYPGQILAPSSFPFSFFPPLPAPAYPPQALHTEPPRRSLPLYQEVQALLTNNMINRSHVRPLEDMFLEPDLAFVQLLRAHWNSLNRVLLEPELERHSDAVDPRSYCNASTMVRKHAKTLVSEYPFIRIDVLTPVPIVDGLFTCVFAGCTDRMAGTRKAVTSHMTKAHLAESGVVCPEKTRVVGCPACEDKMQAQSLGRHVLRRHFAATEVACKLCSGTVSHAKAFPAHFRGVLGGEGGGGAAP